MQTGPITEILDEFHIALGEAKVDHAYDEFRQKIGRRPNAPEFTDHMVQTYGDDLVKAAWAKMSPAAGSLFPGKF